ncbi:hypothetical protein [Paenibacillus phytorum]|nr:hypothetical protein [Paenibacillus phytorum]
MKKKGIAARQAPQLVFAVTHFLHTVNNDDYVCVAEQEKKPAA